MASKRMINLTVIDTDAFLEMPLSTQALYFHLNLRADDDGFVGSPKIICRTVGASDDDLKLLIAKRFIIIFEDGVIVIKHWRMHNTLSVNRYKETNYTEDKALLKLKTNNSYTLGDGKTIDDSRLIEMSKRQVDASKTNNRRTIDEQKTNTDKNRIDKNRIEEISIDKNRIDKTRVDNKEKSIKEKDAAKAATPVKHKYGEYNNVLLTDEELDKLIAEFPDYQKRIENLSNYIASTGKKYKSHYATIKNWARRDGEKQNVKGAKAQELDSFYEMAQRWAESEGE
jgi:hypothetical protein